MELLPAFSALPLPAADIATIRTLVLRLPEEKREEPASITLSVEGGIHGDTWALSPPEPEAQVSLMRFEVANFLAIDGIAALGDNVFADIDTSSANLPPGSLLSIGSTLLEVSTEPHTGCSKFARRTRPGSLALLNGQKPLQLTGIYLRILQGGTISLGDTLKVLRRGPA